MSVEERRRLEYCARTYGYKLAHDALGQQGRLTDRVARHIKDKMPEFLTACMDEAMIEEDK